MPQPKIKYPKLILLCLSILLAYLLFQKIHALFDDHLSERFKRYLLWAMAGFLIASPFFCTKILLPRIPILLGLFLHSMR